MSRSDGKLDTMPATRPAYTVGLDSSGRPLAVSNRRQAATRCSLNMYASVTGNTGGNYWSGHKTPKGCGSISDIELVFSNYLGASHPEANGTGTFTLKAAIEYPTGTYYPVWFNGSRTVSLEAGGVVKSSPVALTIPEDTYFQVHTNPVGAAWSEALMPVRAAQNEGVQRGTTTDRTMTSSGMTIADGSVCLTPNQIIAKMETPVNSVAIFGDSVAAGLLDTSPAEYMGFVAIALGNDVPWVHTAQPSISAFQFGYISGSMWRRMQASLEGITDVIDALGQNDVANAAPYSLAQIQASKVLIWTELQRRGIRVWPTTITPKSDSSDSFATQANLSAAARQGAGGTRIALNAWIRDGCPMTDGVAVATGTADALRTGDVGHPCAGYFEIADIVEVNTSGVLTRDSGIWKLSFLATSDGLGVHPNTTGSTAMAAGIDVDAILAA